VRRLSWRIRTADALDWQARVETYSASLAAHFEIGTRSLVSLLCTWSVGVIECLLEYHVDGVEAAVTRGQP
jgi:hypothetical protein